MFIIHYSVVEHVLFDLFLSYPFTGWDIAMKHYSSLGPQKKKEKIYAARPSNFAWYNFFFDKFLQLFLFFPSFSYSLIIQCVQGDNEQKKGDQRAEQERERRTKPRSRFPPLLLYIQGLGEEKTRSDEQEQFFMQAEKIVLLIFLSISIHLSTVFVFIPDEPYMRFVHNAVVAFSLFRLFSF